MSKGNTMKGDKGNKKGAKFFPGKESFHRMNFLYQAAHVTMAKDLKSCDIPAYYGNSLLSVARKSVLRMEPNIKRDFCKGCSSLLKPGLTVRVRIRSGNLIWTCLRCGTVKRFPTKRQYKLWPENDEACLEVLEENTEKNNDFLQSESAKAKSMKQTVEVPDGKKCKVSLNKNISEAEDGER